MAEAATNGKYLTLEGVRVSHRSKDGSIHLTSSDPDLPQGLHLTLQPGTTVEAQLRSLLEEQGLIEVATREARVPTRAAWHDSYALTTRDSFFPLGLTSESSLMVENPYTGERAGLLGVNFPASPVKQDGPPSHALLVGQPGSGKTNLLKNLARTVRLRSPRWRMDVIDLRGDLASSVSAFPSSTSFFAMSVSSLSDSILVLKSALSRIDHIENAKCKCDSTSHGAAHWTPHLLLVDGLETLLAPEVSPELDGDGALRAEAAGLIADIGLRGSKAGVYMAVSSQRPVHEFLPQSACDTFSTRIVCGRPGPGLEVATLRSAQSVNGRSVTTGSFVMEAASSTSAGMGFVTVK